MLCFTVSMKRNTPNGFTMQSGSYFEHCTYVWQYAVLMDSHCFEVSILTSPGLVMLVPNRLLMSVWYSAHALSDLDNWGSRHIFRICNISVLREHRLRERTPMLRYTNIVCLVKTLRTFCNSAETLKSPSVSPSNYLSVCLYAWT
jgi:hypothetical protein